MDLKANPLSLSWQTLATPWPGGASLSSTALQALTQSAQQRHRAEMALAALQQQMADARQALEQERARLRAQVEDEAAALAEQHAQAARREAVQWLQRAADWEAQLARRWLQRWQPLLAEVVAAVLATQDQTAALLRHVAQQVETRLPRGRLCLAVSPCAFTAAEAAFASQPMVRVQADARLAPTQAELRHELLRMQLDLAQHQAWLLQQLAAPTPEEPVHG